MTATFTRKFNNNKLKKVTKIKKTLKTCFYQNKNNVYYNYIL